MDSVKRQRMYAGALALLLAVAPSLRAQSRPVGQDSVTSVLMRRLSALAADSMEGRRAGTPGGARARAWIIRELQTMGVQPLGPRFEMPFALRMRTPGPDSVGTNIVARIPGTGGSGKTLVLSAHYDHLGIRNGEVFNGADDDASGCVTLLMIAERLLVQPPQHDVILAFFDAEEGGLQGARAFVATPPLPLERIGVNLNLDMVARQDGGALWVSGTAHYPSLRPVAEAAAKESRIPIRFGHDTKDLKPGDDWTNSSDHGAFHAKGIPFLYLGVEDHPDYHKSGDDADKVDPTFFRATMEFAAALVRRLDDLLGR
ncbi:M28 family peptidase [Gemmatimonas phototrophica]|nr:M28 family peptidase [Gemmatimonas phototrophica]